LDWLALGLLLVGGAAASLRFSPTAQVLALKLIARAPNCSWSSIARMKADNEAQVRLSRQLSAASRVIRTDGEIELWDTPRGQYWIARHDAGLISFLLAEQDRQIYGSGAYAVRPGDIVLDCGAHIGVFTRYALNAGAAKVVSIEPSPVNLECLRRNLAPEIASGRVIVYPKGVWSEQTTLSFRVSATNSGTDAIVRDQAQPGDITIPVTTIDKILAELNLIRVDFIKMDIEGAERHAVAGARDTIALFRPRMALCTYHLPDDPVKIPEAVHAAHPAYTFDCGPCGMDKGAFVPETYLFR
jgi:FkbM family methyltransferase